MDLSKDSIKLLRWLRRNDTWKYVDEIEKQYKKFDYRSFKALLDAGFLDHCVFECEIPEYDEYGQTFYPEHYRISDSGKAFLEGLATRWIPELREWIAIGISVLALVVSIIALMR